MIRLDPSKLPSPIRSSPPIGGNAERGRNQLAEHFTTATCPKCHRIILAGTIQGIRLHLEPTMLDDLTEYQALAAGVPTYDLWPDRIARRRHLEQIKWPEQTPRHAQHICDTTYGTHPRPTPAVSPKPSTDAQF